MKINEIKKKSKINNILEKKKATIERQKMGRQLCILAIQRGFQEEKRGKKKKSHHCKFHYTRSHWTF
jgi:hypothetical protein